MPRKTIKIAFAVEKANYFLRNSPDDEKAQRLATANFLETLLHEADAYAGYLHLESAEIDHDGWNKAWDDVRNLGAYDSTPEWSDFCKDDSRRAYLLKGSPYPTMRKNDVEASDPLSDSAVRWT